jgi:hypothetical protein
MPGSVRRLTGTIAAPVLPGVYTATYGYRTDDGQNVQQSRTVIFIPPWSVAFLLAALLVLGAIIRSHHHSRRRRKAQTQAEAVDKTAKD